MEMDLWWDVVKDPRVLLIFIGIPVAGAVSYGWAWVRHRFLRRQMVPLEAALDTDTVRWQHDWPSITSQMSGTFGGRETFVSASVGRFFSVSVGVRCVAGPDAMVGRLTMTGRLNRLLNRGTSIRLPELGGLWIAGPDARRLASETLASTYLRERLQRLFAGSVPTFVYMKHHHVEARYNRRANQLIEPETMALALREVTDLATAIESVDWR